MIKLPSGSRLGLAFSCQGSVLLPQVRSESGEKAKEGTKLHAVLEEFFARGCTPGEAFGDGERKTCERLKDLIGSKFRLGLFYPELAFGVDPSDWSGHIGKYAVGSDKASDVETSNATKLHVVSGYNVNPLLSDGVPDGERSLRAISESERSNWYLAVADLVGRDESNNYVILDWKSGSSWLPDPAWNWQLLLPAIAIQLITGNPANTYTVATVKLESGGPGDYTPSFTHEPVTLGSADIERRAASLKWLHGRLESYSGAPEKTPLNEGRWCGFCPARDRCPAKIGAIAAAIKTLGFEADDMSMLKAALLLTESSPMLSKAKIEIMDRLGPIVSLGDGREAVLEVDGKGKKKVYTRKVK